MTEKKALSHTDDEIKEKKMKLQNHQFSPHLKCLFFSKNTTTLNLHWYQFAIHVELQLKFHKSFEQIFGTIKNPKKTMLKHDRVFQID